MTNPANKLDGYRRRIYYEWNQHRQRVAARKRVKVFDGWLSSLVANPPDVLLGANFAAYGGVRHHLQAILRYSAMKTELAPPAQVMRSLATHHVVHDYRDKFRKFSANGIKVVHSHVFPWYIEWCREQQKRGVPWVHTYHLNYYPEHAEGSIHPWQQDINESLVTVAPYADLCLSVSRWQVIELNREFGISAEYLPNGVDVEACNRANPERLRRKFNLEEFILYVGRDDPVKNPLEFIELAHRIPDRTFVMVGGGLSEEGMAAASPSGIPKNLVVLGPLPHEETLDAIAACNVLVVTSKREGLPTLVMEAMARQRPVVVPNEPGCVEVIDHGAAGFIYRLGDVDDLVEKTLAASEDEVRKVNAKERVLSNYDWKVVGPKLDAAYARVLR